jgi:hypothetical protein
MSKKNSINDKKQKIDTNKYEGEESLPEPDIPEECYDPDTGLISEERIEIYLKNKETVEKKTVVTVKESPKITTTTTVETVKISSEKSGDKKERKTIDIKSDIRLYNKESILVYINLSKDNFIMKYIDTMRQMTSSYSEYHFAMAVSILSIISDRRLKLSMRHKDIYPNIWFFLLGLSTVSQKSTAFDLGEETLSKISIESELEDLMKNKLPGSFSPEGFGKALLKCNGHGYEWKDESGELLKNMEKEYMSNMRDFLCDLYGNKEFYRSLMKSDIFVKTPFVNMVLATTPDTFREYTKIGDLTSGWLYRFIYLYPEYEKSWMSVGKRTDKDNNNIRELVLLLKKKVNTISAIKIGGEVNFEFESGCLEFYEKWSEKMYYKVQKGKNQTEAAFVGRLEDYVLKLAIIFTFGEPGFKLEISNKIMEMTCQLVENYFLPTALEIAEMVEKNIKGNQIERILDIIRTSGGTINRSNLLRKSRLKAKELDDVCHTLVESEEILMSGEQRTRMYKLSKCST